MSDTFIPLSAPDLTPAEASAMQECILSGWVSTAGPQVKNFEEALCDYTGSAHAIAVSSGSAALFVALKAMGLRPGEMVLVPSLTFIATANAPFHLGATMVLVDVNPQTWQMDPALLEGFLQAECEVREEGTFHLPTGKKVFGFVAVHALGHPGPVAVWQRIAQKYKLKWVEDAAAALGSFREGKHAGITADAGILSFNGNKVLTTGAGGMVLTADNNLAEIIRHLCNQGYAADRKGEYLHDIAGHNLGMSALNASLGLAQLKRLPEMLQRRKALHDFYLSAFEGETEICMFRNAEPGVSAPNHWLNVVAVNNPLRIRDQLASKGMGAGRLWIPLHKQPVYKDCRYLSADDNSARIYGYGLALPSSSQLNEMQMQKIQSAVKAAAQS